MNSYELSRHWFNWAFENPEKVKPIHSAVYFFAMEHCNRLGNKSKFGFPSQMTMDAIGVRKIQTYSKAFNDLVEWGFFILVERSKNQYSANIISISAVPKNGTARGKALDKANIQHGAKQGHDTGQSMGQSKDTIIKPLTNKPINQEQINILLKKEPKEKSFIEKINLAPFQESFREEWEKWIEYKKTQWKQTYKRIETQQTAFKHLLELSKGNPADAKKIIDQSIGNLWKGLIELKSQQNGKENFGNNRNGNQQTGTGKVATDFSEPL